MHLESHTRWLKVISTLTAWLYMSRSLPELLASAVESSMYISMTSLWKVLCLRSIHKYLFPICKNKWISCPFSECVPLPIFLRMGMLLSVLEVWLAVVECKSLFEILKGEDPCILNMHILFVHLGRQPPTNEVEWEDSLPLCWLPPHFIDLFLCCAKAS